MKTKNKLGEITFENFIQLRDFLEEAWNRGKLEQSVESLNKEKNSYKELAKKLGIKNFDPAEKIETPMSFQEWFLEITKTFEKI